VDGAEAALSNFLVHAVVVQNCAVIKNLPVDGHIEHIVCLNEIDVLVEELDALLVIQNARAYFLFAAEALAGGFNDLAQRGPVFITKVHDALLLRLVHASVNSDFYLLTSITEEIYHFSLVVN